MKYLFAVINSEEEPYNSVVIVFSNEYSAEKFIEENDETFIIQKVPFIEE